MALLIDAIIIAVLIASIAYNWHVAGKVRGLMIQLADLEPALQAFSKAVDRSAASVDGMLSATDEFKKIQEAAATAAEVKPRPTPAAEVDVESDNGDPVIRDFFEKIRARTAS